jgi:hypothetical protein
MTSASIARVLKDLADGGPGAQEAHARFGEHMRRLVAGLAVPARELVRRPSAFLRGMNALPVRFTPVHPSGDLL